MKKIYKFSLFILILLIGYSLGKINNMNDVYEEEKIQSPKKNTNMLSMMLETDAGSGNYEMTTRDTWPTSGYKFNSTLSKCENGGELSWDNENKRVLMSGNTSDKCYVYFDIAVLNLSLDNYIFNWKSVDGASSYQIYSNDELLTSTSDTSAEIYGYYNEPGTYNISVKAIDSSSNVLLESNSVSYNLEKLDFNLESNYIKKHTDNFSHPHPSLRNGTTFVSPIVNLSTGYSINYFQYNTYSSNNKIDLSYCITNACDVTDISKTISISGGSFGFSFSDMKFSVLCSGCFDGANIAFQLSFPGKIASDWYVLNFWFDQD